MSEKAKRDLYLCGDIHGELKALVWTLTERYNISNAEVIILGDFGIGFDKAFPDLYKSVENKLEKHDIILNTLRGNHDDPAYFIKPVNYPRLNFLEDHKVYNICDKDIYIIGGAHSTDIEYRLEENEKRLKKHKLPCWWEDECVVEENDLPAHVDIIASHTAPLNFDPVITRDNVPIEQYKKIIRERKYLNKVLYEVRADFWFYGHFHKSYSGSYNSLLYKCLEPMEIYLAPDKINHNPQGELK